MIPRLAPAGTGWHLQANFFHGINHGIVALKIRASTKYHAVLSKLFMVSKFDKSLIINKKHQKNMP